MTLTLSEMEHRAEYRYDLEISIFVCATENIPKEQSQKILERLRSLTPLFSELKWKEDKIDDISELMNYVKKRKAEIGAFDLNEHDTSHEDSEIAILKESIEKSRYEIKTKFNAEFDIIQLKSLLVESLAEEFYKILDKVHVTLQMKFTHHGGFDSQNSRGCLDTVTEITSRIHNKQINTCQGTRIHGTIIRMDTERPRVIPEEKGVVQKIKEWWNIKKANQ